MNRWLACQTKLFQHVEQMKSLFIAACLGLNLLMPQRAIFAANLETVPTLLAPLTWDSTDQEIVAQPGVHHSEPNHYNSIHFDRLFEVDALLYHKQIPVLGEALLYVERLDGKMIAIRLESDEQRPACLKSRKAPRDCRNRDIKGLNQSFYKLKALLEKQYGAPYRSLVAGTDKAAYWKSETSAMSLFLGKDEYDGLAVTLLMERRDRLPQKDSANQP